MRISKYFWWLVLIVGCFCFFAFLPQNFDKVVGAYEWYFVSLWLQFEQFGTLIDGEFKP